MIDLLKPEVTVEPRPVDPDMSRYVRSYLIMRIFIGALAVALPFLLVLIDGFGFDGDPFPRDSLSAYYYSGVRELFVGTLSATAVFLVTYKVADRTLGQHAERCRRVRGAARDAVSHLHRPSGVGLTPLQELLGVSAVKAVHFVAAGAFIVSLGVISFFFGVREGTRAPREGRRSPTFWRGYHWSCAGAIAAAVVWIVVTALVGEPSKALLIGEAVAVWAFGASWLMKGLELDFLRRR